MEWFNLTSGRITGAKDFAWGEFVTLPSVGALKVNTLRLWLNQSGCSFTS